MGLRLSAGFGRMRCACASLRRGPLSANFADALRSPMAVLTLDRWNMAIGDGEPLMVMAGMNVLEDEGLALEIARHLQGVCADLALPFVFKASFDKANRSSIHSYRGPGLENGLK